MEFYENIGGTSTKSQAVFGERDPHSGSGVSHRDLSRQYNLELHAGFRPSGVVEQPEPKGGPSKLERSSGSNGPCVCSLPA